MDDYFVDDGSEVGGDFVVGDGVAGGALVQADLQKELKALLLLGAVVLRRHFLAAQSKMQSETVTREFRVLPLTVTPFVAAFATLVVRRQRKEERARAR